MICLDKCYKNLKRFKHTPIHQFYVSNMHISYFYKRVSCKEMHISKIDNNTTKQNNFKNNTTTMKIILQYLVLLLILCCCGGKETEELCPRFFNTTPDTITIVTFIKSSGSPEKVDPNTLSSIWMVPYTLDILEGINSHLDSISICDEDSNLICKFTKAYTFNYKGNPFTDRNKWLYQGVRKEKRLTQRITYVNLHEYWFKIEYDSIIYH